MAEQALYAALAPSPQTLAPLKAACHTWADHLWAQVSVICEEKESVELERLKGSFWEGASPNVIGGAGSEEWEESVVKSLEVLGSIGVEEGWVFLSLESTRIKHSLDSPPADSPYHISQLHIILGRMDELLGAFAGGLRDGEYDPSLPE